MVEALRPQLVLMDIQMPEMDGLEACEIIKSSSPGIKVVLYTMHEMYGASAPGKADMFVAKDRLFDELPGIVGTKAT